MTEEMFKISGKDLHSLSMIVDRLDFLVDLCDADGDIVMSRAALMAMLAQFRDEVSKIVTQIQNRQENE